MTVEHSAASEGFVCGIFLKLILLKYDLNVFCAAGTLARAKKYRFFSAK